MTDYKELLEKLKGGKTDLATVVYANRVIRELIKERDDLAARVGQFTDGDYNRLAEANARVLRERDEWREVARRAGVCMSCAVAVHMEHGCTDCLGTGWDNNTTYWAKASRAEGYSAGIEAAAKVAESRHAIWEMPHRDDARPFEVCDDVSACADIAAAIRELEDER